MYVTSGVSTKSRTPTGRNPIIQLVQVTSTFVIVRAISVAKRFGAWLVTNIELVRQVVADAIQNSMRQWRAGLCGDEP